MAEGEKSLIFLDNEKDLEEGEIDDLEEGEIDEGFEGISEYRFSAREEKSSSENDLLTRQHKQPKPESLAHTNQRNSFRNTKYSRDRNERRTETHSSRSYEKAGRNRAGFKQNFAGKKQDESLRGDTKYRTHDATASWRNEDLDSYSSNVDNNYPHRTPRQPTLREVPSDLNEDMDEQNDDGDFKRLLEQYKHIQEQLDGLEFRPKHRSLVDDVIDDSFVDVPLDDVGNSEKPQDNLDTEIRKLELDFNQTKSIDTEISSGDPVQLDYMKYLQSIPTISQSIPTTYVNDENNYNNYDQEQPFFGIFEPFQIKPVQKKVRSLSELNQIDMASRGLVGDRDGQAKVTNGRSKPKGKNKASRRPNKSIRRRMKRKAASNGQSGSKLLSSDAHENNGSILIKKQKLKEWQKHQHVFGKGNNMESLRDDYIQTPMEVETDSTESAGVIEESHPPLPPIDLSQPPPPGEELEISSTSHIIPLMNVKLYGYFYDYGSLWWGGPELPHATQPYFTEQSATIHESIHTAHENTEIRPNENNTTQTLEQNSLNLTQQADLEVEDEASELALREQLLKSIVTKRAAKNAGKVNEKSAASSVASPSNSRAPSPFAEPGTRKGLQEVVKSEATKAAKVNIAPPKHEPVVIHLGADSDDSESDGESPIKRESNSFFGGLDSFIKEARERSSKSKSSEVKPQKEIDDKNDLQPSTPTTPEVVSVLSEEKRNEYKKLKLQLALKEQRKGLVGSRKENVSNDESAVKQNENVATKHSQEKKHFAKRVVLDAQNGKQKAPKEKHSGNRRPGIETQTQERQQQQLLHLQQQQQQQQKQQQERQQKHQRQTQPEQQKQDEMNEQQQAEATRQKDLNHELELKLKILSEMVLGHKRLIMQDQKLLESCEDQLDSSSKALEEHQRRVSLLQQQLERAERLKKVQQDLVEKLKIQSTKLNQRVSKRQSDAREVEERLLRTRALLVAQKSQKTSVITGRNSLSETKPTVSSPEYQNPSVVATGEKFLAQIEHTGLKPGQDSQDGGINSTREKFREMSRILEESVPNEKELKSAPSRKNDKDSASMSKTTTPSKTPMEDKEITEKKRLRILEQTLSQKLRLSNARRQIGKESGSIRKEIGKKSGTSSLLQREERASSDSELIVKRNVSPRGLTPPVELVGGSHLDEEDGGLRTQLMVNMFKDNHKLQKVKRIQAERETNGPSFTRVCNNLALPARFTSTKCAWLRIEDLSEHLGDITGCLSAVVSQTPSVDKSQVMEQTQWTRRATGPYRSPLVYFRSYRFSPYYRTKKGFTLDSRTFTNLINPLVPFCPFALHGICSDPECPHQHPDEVIPKDKQILEDLAAYFASAGKKLGGNDDVTDDIIKSITRTIDAVTKQYGDKVSPAELRVLFVNYLRKQKSAGIFNIVLDRRRWRPISHTKKDPGTSAPGTNAPGDEYPVVQTEKTFSWKSWRRKIENEIKTRSEDRDECQEIRYFSENYDSVKTLEKGTQENPSDESLWIRLATVHMGSNRTEGDKNNNSRKNVDRALNTLVQALEYNRHSEKLWLKYLDVFRQRATTDELHEVCEEAVELAGSYKVWWAYIDIASDYERKTNVCLKCIEFLVLSDTEMGLKSHRLLEIFLYLVQLDLHCGFFKVALNRFRVALNCVDGPRDTREILAFLAENTICEDLCSLWLSYIHLVEFSCLPREFYDPARTSPARIVRKDGVVLPWKPGAGTRHGSAELLKLFHRALKECAAVSNSPDKVSPVFSLYKNLIALERACGKDASSVRTCQRLLKASPKKIELWLCMSALQQVSGQEDGAVNVYKKALETCNGHAQIAYCAAKYFIQTQNRDECYEALTKCVYSKFILEVPSSGPKTRARSHDQPTILRPSPGLLYKKLLSQTLPLDSTVPSAKPGVRPGNLGAEETYIWLCYCMFIELFSDKEPTERHSLTQAAYESAIYSTGDRHEVKTLWIEYIYYMVRVLKEKLCKSEELHDIFHKCLTTVPAVTPVLNISSRSWSDYNFHNEVLGLYRRCLGDAFSSNVYDKYLEMFPDNSILAIQAVEHLYKNRELDKARKILSGILLKTPYCLDLWKIAISIELKEEHFDQARQLFEHATEALPLAASLWKDFAMFELAHDSNKMERLQSIVNKTKDRGIDIEDFLKELTLNDT